MKTRMIVTSCSCVKRAELWVISWTPDDVISLDFIWRQMAFFILYNFNLYIQWHFTYFRTIKHLLNAYIWCDYQIFSPDDATHSFKLFCVVHRYHGWIEPFWWPAWRSEVHSHRHHTGHHHNLHHLYPLCVNTRRAPPAGHSLTTHPPLIHLSSRMCVWKYCIGEGEHFKPVN